MNKPMYKSKTLNGILVVAIMVILQMLGVGEQERAKTYEGLNSDTKNNNITELVTLVGAGIATYGRLKVKHD